MCVPLPMCHCIPLDIGEGGGGSYAFKALSCPVRLFLCVYLSLCMKGVALASDYG